MATPLPFAAQTVKSNAITASAHLPATLIALDDWALVTLTGPDTRTYLQGQVTADVNALAPDQHVLCGHCDAKGKMWSALRLFAHNDGFAYLVRRNLRDTQLNELKNTPSLPKPLSPQRTISSLSVLREALYANV